MKKRKLLIGLLLVAAIVGGYLFFNRTSDEQVILKNLAAIVELVQKKGDESVFVLIGDSRKIMQYISEHPEIDLGSPLPLIRERDELESLIIQVRQTVQTLNVRVARKELTLSEDQTGAQMELVLVATGVNFDETGRERRNFSIDWIKEDGEWLVKNVRHHGQLYP